MNMVDNYNYAGGCWFKHPRNPEERANCEAGLSKNKDADTDRILANAVLAKTSKDAEKGMTPLQITGIVFGSMMSIAIMIVIIKRVKSKRG